MKISVIIPAHNEEEYLPIGLAAVSKSAKICPCEVEVIVVLNRCHDRTEEIARKAGAIIAREEAKNLALIRNAGFTKVPLSVLSLRATDIWSVRSNSCTTNVAVNRKGG